MSHHILHVLQHGSVLGKDRGFLTCKNVENGERRLPIQDIRAVVIAARGVTLSSTLMGSLTESDAIILHCNERYEPCGLTSPLTRINDTQAFLTQASRPVRLNERIWQKLLRGKTRNQMRVLECRNLRSPQLEFALKNQSIDEANCARYYWQLYFPAIGYSGSKRERKMENPPNQMLNYGYAVLASLCHRSIVVHGLSPLLGVHHKPRASVNPLVYDLMEPYRPCVDKILAEFLLTPDLSMKAWARHIGAFLKDCRVEHAGLKAKLLDAIDLSVESLVASYRKKEADPFWVPVL